MKIKKIIISFLFLQFLLFPTFASSSAPHFEEIDNHKVLLVDAKPFILIGVQDQKGFSEGSWDASFPNPSWPWNTSYETYFQKAKELGFNTIVAVIPWYKFETEEGNFPGEVYGGKHYGYEYLKWLRDNAQANGLKILIRWNGSNVGAVANGVPDYIKADPVKYPKILDKNGELPHTPDYSTTYEVYSWASDYLREKEKAALNKLMTWIKENDPDHTFVMLDPAAELGLRYTDRSYDPLSEAKWVSEGYADPEKFTQDIEIAYLKAICDEIKAVYPDFPIMNAVFDRSDGSGSPARALSRWLNEVPSIDLFAPSIYGWNYGQAPAYYDEYKIERNISFTTPGSDQLPYLHIFNLLDGHYQGVGLISDILVGDPDLTAKYKAFTNRWSNWAWFDRAYYMRNSMSAIFSAASKIAEFTGTNRLGKFVAYSYSAWNEITKDPHPKTLNLDGLSIEVSAGASQITEGTAKMNPSRGVIIRTAEKDFTLVGVDYTAKIQIDMVNGADKWEKVVAERGYWDRDSWIKVGEPLLETAWIDSETGYVILKLSSENMTTDVSVSQYALRVYESTDPAATSLLIQPSTPTGLTASAASGASTGAGYAILSWNQNPEESFTQESTSSGYNIYRSLTSASGFEKIASVSAPKTTYLDSNLSAGSTYYYKITVYNINPSNGAEYEGSYADEIPATIVISQPYQKEDIFFGVGYAQDGYAASFTDLGAKMVKIASIYWGNLEPDAPTTSLHKYNFTSLDNLVEEYLNAGFKVHIVLHSGFPLKSSSWATADKWFPEALYAATPPKEGYWDDYAAFIKAVVDRYDGEDDAGKYLNILNQEKDIDLEGLDSSRKVLIYEIESEAEHKYLWQGKTEDSSLSDYLRLLQVAYLSAKSANPQAQIILSGIALSDVFDNFPAINNVSELKDYIAAHKSGEAKDLLDKVVNFVEGSLKEIDFYDLVEFHALNNYTGIYQTTNLLRSIIQQAAGSPDAKPLWAGDTTSAPMYFSDENRTNTYEDDVIFNPPYDFSEEDEIHSGLRNSDATYVSWYRAEQAKLTIKKYLAAIDSGLQHMGIGTLSDWAQNLPDWLLLIGTGGQDFGFQGLHDGTRTEPSGNPRPVYYTLQKLLIQKRLDQGQLENIETQITVVGGLPAKPEGAMYDPKAYAYKFTIDGNPIYVLWYDDGFFQVPGESEGSIEIELPIGSPYNSAKVTPIITSLDQTEPQSQDYTLTNGTLSLTLSDTPLLIEPQIGGPPDTTPPAPVSEFQSSYSSGTITFSWVNPTDSDFAGVKLIRKIGSYPTSEVNGEIIYQGSETTTNDVYLENSYYKIFAYDSSNNFSSGGGPEDITSPNTTSLPHESSPFGIFGTSHTQTYVWEDYINYLPEIGVNWIKNPGANTLPWVRVQNAKGANYNFSYSDSLIQSAQNVSANIILTLNPNAEWEHEPEKLPNDLSAFGDFVQAMVERYDGDGYNDMPSLLYPIKYWVIGNEPDLPAFWNDTPENFAILTKTAHDAVKRADPTAKLILPGTHGSIAGYLYKGETIPEGFPQSVGDNAREEGKDGFFIRMFTKLNEIAPEKLDIYGMDFHFFYWVGDYLNIKTLCSYIDRLTQDFGYGIREKLSFEMGTFSGQNIIFKGEVKTQSEKEQSQELIKRFVYGIANKVKKSYWEYLLAEVNSSEYFDNFGLIIDDTSKTKKLGYYTYKFLMEKLAGFDWESASEVLNQDNVYVYKFFKDGKSFYIAWYDYFNEATTSKEISINLDGITTSQVKITEFVPNAESGEAINEGDYPNFFAANTYPLASTTLTLSLGQNPVLIEEYFNPTPPDIPALTHGPMVGAVTEDSAKVWFRVSPEASVQVEYALDPDFDDDPKSSATVITSSDADYSGAVTLTGLTENTTYYYRILVDGKVQTTTFQPQFKTFPSSASLVKVGILTDIKTDASALAPAIEALSTENPDFVLVLGDWDHRNVFNLEEMREMHRENRGDEKESGKTFRDHLLYKFPVAHVWDDHDYGGNNGDKTFNKKDEAIQAYDEYWPTYERPNPQAGIWHKFTYGNLVEVFMLDLRSQRDVNSYLDERYDPDQGGWPANPTRDEVRNAIDRSMLDGDEYPENNPKGQKQWFKDSLLNSTAKWKIIASTVPWNPTTPKDDAWWDFRAEQKELLEFIRDNNITGVMAVSGDIHAGGGIDDGTNTSIDGIPNIVEMNVPTTNLDDPDTSSRLHDPKQDLGDGNWSHGFTGDGVGYGLITLSPTSALIEARDENRNIVRDEVDAARELSLTLTLDSGSDTTPPAPPTGLEAEVSSPTVSLNWDPNTEEDLAGYNVYRTTTSGSDYLRLNSELLTVADYQDTNLTNGLAYSYVVTAVDTSGNESEYSSEIFAVPFDAADTHFESGLFQLLHEDDEDNANVKNNLLVGARKVFSWGDIETADDTFDWTTVESFINTWAAKGKKVVIGVITASDGGDEEGRVPEWLYTNSDPSKNIKIVACPDQQNSSKTRIWPVYWDEVYLSKWREFVEEFARRYDGDPRIEYLEAGIGRSGHTMISSPIALTNIEERNPSAYENFIEAGYSPDLWTYAIKRIIDIYHDNFKNTRVAVDLMPLRFPPSVNDEEELNINDAKLYEISDYTAKHGNYLISAVLNEDAETYTKHRPFAWISNQEHSFTKTGLWSDTLLFLESDPERTQGVFWQAMRNAIGNITVDGIEIPKTYISYFYLHRKEINDAENPSYPELNKAIQWLINNLERGDPPPPTTTDTEEPNKPTALSISQSDNKLELSWQANSETDLVGYNIYRRDESSGYVKLNSSPYALTTYQDENLTFGVTYTYFVTAIDTSSNESSPSDTVSITLTEPELDHVTITPDPQEMVVNTTLTFTAKGYDQNGDEIEGLTFSWSVTNSSAGTIDQNGNFSASTSANQTTDIVAQATYNGETKDGKITITTIASSLDQITVSPSQISLEEGAQQKFTALGFDKYDNEISIFPIWSTNAGTINSQGILTAQLIAEANKFVTAEVNGIKGTALVNIIDTISPADVSDFTALAGDQKITLSWNNPSDHDFSGVKILRKNDSYPANPEDGTLVYEGNDTTFEDTGLSNGTTYYYTAFTYDEIPNYSNGIQVQATPTEAIVLDHITITPDPKEIVVDTSLTFIAKGYDQNGDEIEGLTFSWSVTNSSAGSVDQNGLFTSLTLANQTTDIVAQATYQGVTKDAKVTITTIPSSLDHIIISPPEVSLEEGATQKFTASGFDQYDNQIDIEPIWSTNAGTINSEGMLTAQLTAEANKLVTAEANGISTHALVNIIDTISPENVSNFIATAGDQKITLSWNNPSDHDFAGVKILRKENSYPANPNDGTPVYNGKATSFEDTNLTNGVTYYYTIFTMDEIPNYSQGVKISGTPQDLTSPDPPQVYNFRVHRLFANIPELGWNYVYGSSYVSCLIVRSSIEAVNWEPIDGAVYNVGQIVEKDIKVVYGKYPQGLDSTSSFKDEVDGELPGGITYYYRAYAYDAERNYNTERTSAETVGALPTITNISPSESPIGTIVTIEGKAFGSERGEEGRVLFLKATKEWEWPLDRLPTDGTAAYAEIISWTDNSIMVRVPWSATDSFVCVYDDNWNFSNYDYYFNVLPPSHIPQITASAESDDEIKITWLNPVVVDLNDPDWMYNYVGVLAVKSSSESDLMNWLPEDGTDWLRQSYEGGNVNLVGPITYVWPYITDRLDASEIGMRWYYRAFAFDYGYNYNPNTEDPVAWPPLSLAPSIESFDPPASSTETHVTIYGQGFGKQGGMVWFASRDGRTEATVESWNDTSLKVIIPQGAVDGLVVVENGDGIRSDEYYGPHFNVLAPEQIWNFTAKATTKEVTLTWEMDDKITAEVDDDGIEDGRVTKVLIARSTDENWIKKWLPSDKTVYTVPYWAPGAGTKVLLLTDEAKKTFVDTTNLTKGVTYYYRAFAHDDGPNYNTVEAIVSIVAGEEEDTTPPTVTIDSLADNSSSQAQIIFTGKAYEDKSEVSKVEYRIDEGTWKEAQLQGEGKEVAYQTDEETFSDGYHTIEARATNSVNLTSELINYSFLVDTTPPVVEVEGVTEGSSAQSEGMIRSSIISQSSVGIRNIINSTYVLLVGSAYDSYTPITSVKVSIDEGKTWDLADPEDGKFDAQSERFFYRFKDKLSDGKHMVMVKADDTLSWTKEIKYTFQVDTVRPAISDIQIYREEGTAALSDGIISSTPLIKIKIADEGGDLDFKSIKLIFDQGTKIEREIIEGIIITAVSSNEYEISYRIPSDKPLSTGEHTIKIQVQDQAGNTSIQEIKDLKVYAESNISGTPFNYPNPFNPDKESTKISFTLTKDAHLFLYLYDVTLQPILRKEIAGQAGYNEVLWDGKTDFGDTVGSGLYLCRLLLEEGGTKKVIGKIKIAVLKN